MNKKNRGFTLIELMVTIAVLAIIAAMAAPSFNSMLIRQNLKSSAYHLKDELRNAKSRAQVKQSDVVVCTSLDKTNTIVTQGSCGAALSNYAAMSSSLQNESVFIVNLEKKITVDSSSNDHVTFTSRGNTSATTTIKLCSSEGSYLVTTSIPGNVEISQAGAC